MYRLLVLYNKPEDPESWEKAYLTGHVPLASMHPNLRNLRVGKVQDTLEGEHSFYYAAELEWDSKEDMLKDLQADTSVSRAAKEDGKKYKGQRIVIGYDLNEYKADK